MIGGQLAVALQVSDADLDAAFGEFRLLRGALQFAQPGASGLGLGGQGLAFDLGVGETRLMLGQFLVQRFEAGLGFLARGAQVFLVGRDFLRSWRRREARSPDCSACCCRRECSSWMSCTRRVTSATRWRAGAIDWDTCCRDLGAGHGGAGRSAISCCALISRCRFSISCWRASRPACSESGA